MYYQNYEDYMRSVLGYPIEPTNTYAAYSNPYETMQMTYDSPTRYSDEIMNLYPEIYRIVNPMVCKICEANTKSITPELIDQMTDEIYMNLEIEPEIDTIVNVRANVLTDKSELEENRISSDKNSNSLSKTTNRNSTSNTINSTSRMAKDKQNKEIKEGTETRNLEKESRQRRPNNRILRDLIRILILNQLLGGNFPNRPPHRPPRPPMPPVRPPFPRENRFYENYLR